MDIKSKLVIDIKGYLLLGIVILVLSALVIGISVHFYNKYENIIATNPISKVDEISDINILKNHLRNSIELDLTWSKGWFIMFLLTGVALLLSALFILNVYLAVKFNPNNALKQGREKASRPLA